jgi:hypothetical protein
MVVLQRGRKLRAVVLAGAGAALASLSLLPGARAQGNDLSAPTGGRSALMGGTGVALANDGSAPFLNPATIVRINDRSLAFSVNFYTFSDTHLSNWHQPGPVDATQFGAIHLSGTAISSNGFHVFPSTLCLFFTLAGVTEEGANDGGFHRGRQKLAVCLGNTEAQNIGLPALALHSTTALGTTAQVQSISQNWNRFRVGPTYSVSLSDAFAIGASLHGVYSADSFAFDSSAITSAAAGGAIESTLGAGGNAHSFDMTAILGAMFRAGPWTFGASVEVPALHLLGTYDAVLHQDSQGTGTSGATISSGSGGFSAPPPMRFALGLGARWSRLVLELDESVGVPAGAIASTLNVTNTTLAGTTATTTNVDSTFSVAERPVWNTALGAEYFVSPSFSVLGGAATNLTALPPLSPTSTLGNLVQTRTSLATASFGIGSYGSGGDILIGARFGYGWGQSMAANSYVLPNAWAVVETQSYSVMLVLAGATNLRAIGRAVEKAEKAVTTGNPELPPVPRPASSPAGPAPTTAPPPSPTIPRAPIDPFKKDPL